MEKLIAFSTVITEALFLKKYFVFFEKLKGLNKEEITEFTFKTHCIIGENTAAVYNPQVLLAGQPELNSCFFGHCLHSAVSCQKPVFSHPFHLCSPRSPRHSHGAQQAHFPSKKR